MDLNSPPIGAIRDMNHVGRRPETQGGGHAAGLTPEQGQATIRKAQEVYLPQGVTTASSPDHPDLPDAD